MIELLNVKNPKWKTLKSYEEDAEGNVTENVITDDEGNPIKVIDCECQWSHLGDDTQDYLPFTATSEDTEEHGKKLYQDLVDGKYGAIEDES
tara:strand:+ start:1054 stop:1329 length:276 start_codon:yes stop_codon:yes gene_type:complete